MRGDASCHLSLESGAFLPFKHVGPMAIAPPHPHVLDSCDFIDPCIRLGFRDHLRPSLFVAERATIWRRWLGLESWAVELDRRL